MPFGVWQYLLFLNLKYVCKAAQKANQPTLGYKSTEVVAEYTLLLPTIKAYPLAVAMWVIGYKLTESYSLSSLKISLF